MSVGLYGSCCFPVTRKGDASFMKIEAATTANGTIEYIRLPAQTEYQRTIFHIDQRLFDDADTRCSILAGIDKSKFTGSDLFIGVARGVRGSINGASAGCAILLACRGLVVRENVLVTGIVQSFGQSDKVGDFIVHPVDNVKLKSTLVLRGFTVVIPFDNLCDAIHDCVYVRTFSDLLDLDIFEHG